MEEFEGNPRSQGEKNQYSVLPESTVQNSGDTQMVPQAQVAMPGDQEPRGSRGLKTGSPCWRRESSGRVRRGAACSCYSLSAHIKLKTAAGRKGRGHREDQSCAMGRSAEGRTGRRERSTVVLIL